MVFPRHRVHPYFKIIILVSDSKANGLVSLPRDLSRNAGSSSGGAAALISSGITTISAASDGGGSIRIPASFNGLIGLKPIHLPLLSYEALYDSSLPKLRIAFLINNPDGSRQPSQAQAAVLKASQFLEKQGHIVEEMSALPLDMEAVMDAYYFMNVAETAAMFDHIQMSLGRNVTKEDMEVMTWAIYQSGEHILAKDYSKTLQYWDNYSAAMARFHEKYDLLITATTTQVAPKHGQLTPDSNLMRHLSQAEEFSSQQQLRLVEQMFSKGLAVNPYTPLANLTGQPVISLPLYLDQSTQLPIGVQFMAAKGREDLLLALVISFERHHQFIW